MSQGDTGTEAVPGESGPGSSSEPEASGNRKAARDAEARGRGLRRVVVTGLGAVTPMATGVQESWDALCRGASAITPVTRFDTSGMRTRIGGQISRFDAGDFMDRRTERRYDRFVVLALAASRMAVQDAALGPRRPAPERIGVMMGNCMGGAELIEESCRLVGAGGHSRLPPFFIPGAIGSSSPGVVAIELAAKGPIALVNTACASGADAIGRALQSLRLGEADAVIAGGSEAPLTPLLYAGLGAMRATSSRNDDPARASRPFDRDRDGFVPAEGAAALVLESLDSAIHRGARIYAEASGYGASCDAYHITTPDPGAAGAVAAMRAALRDAGVTPEEVDHVNAHGTSTPLNDRAETAAIKAVFGQRARTLPVSSNKSVCGHTIGAAGALEAVFSILTIRDGLIPPTANYENPDPELDLDYVPNHPRRHACSTVLSNSFGFGGANACLVFRRWDEGSHNGE